jgi:AcrR family transcriptional regulator
MGRGRPRKTDPDDALETAMRLFWERGFEATSMNDVAAATGMAKPGLYATFGDKEALYGRALTHYVETYGAPFLDELVNAPTPLADALRHHLMAIVDNLLNPETPGGCFLANCVVECSAHESTREALSRAYDETRRKAFVKRFRKARSAGELPAASDPTALGEFFAGQAVALGVLARGGADRKRLERFVDVAMTAIPAAPARH